jgi:hypothetical protein
MYKTFFVSSARPKSNDPFIEFGFEKVDDQKKRLLPRENHWIGEMTGRRRRFWEMITGKKLVIDLLLEGRERGLIIAGVRKEGHRKRKGSPPFSEKMIGIGRKDDRGAVWGRSEFRQLGPAPC